MARFIVHPQTEKQEKALILIFEAFDLKYEKELDETEYLMSTEANKKALDESIQQLKDGNGIRISLEDLWK